VITEFKVSPDLDSLSQTALSALLEVAHRSIDERNRFSLVLSGGATPGPLFRMLGGEAADDLTWEKTHLFWGDERRVGPEDPASNFRMVHETILAAAPIPEANVHRIMGEATDPDAAAMTYEEELREFLSAASVNGSSDAPEATDNSSSSAPEALFDLALLGIGGDGHTASLFPGDPVLNESERWVRAVKAPDYRPPTDRITLTVPALNRTRAVFFLASGVAKQGVVEKILALGQEGSPELPASLIRPLERLVWFLDEAAAPEEVGPQPTEESA
jgi:6-phosphogluconolactonase